MSAGRIILYWLSRVLVAVALVILAGSLTLWIGSYWRGENMRRSRWNLSATTDEWWTDDIYIGGGVFEAASRHVTQPAFVGNFTSDDAPFTNNRTVPAGRSWQAWSVSSLSRPAWPHVSMGIGWWSGPNGWRLDVELWLPTLIAAAGFLIAIFFARRASRPLRRLRQGLCPACGYDIRATPARCPECGELTGEHYGSRSRTGIGESA